MIETNQQRVERLITERNAAVNQLAEWFVRTQREYNERPETVSKCPYDDWHPYCRPYTIHELLDKAISDLKAKETSCQRTT
jgi:hypothetical protein